MKIVSILLVTFILLGSSCQTTSSDVKLLAPIVDYVSDTMFARRKPMIEAQVDSLCLTISEEHRQKAIDSLLSIERARINELTR